MKDKLTIEAEVPQMTERQQIQQVPQRAIQRVVSSYSAPVQQGVPPGYRVRDDLMTGKKTLVADTQREAWTR